jgi:hypothetical protein
MSVNDYVKLLSSTSFHDTLDTVCGFPANMLAGWA